MLEGEFVKGKYSKGKEYNEKGKLVFEGEYLYGEKNYGIVKEYNKKGNLIFEGRYLNGEKIKEKNGIVKVS